MSAEFSRKRILDRVWARFAEPRTAGLALLALGFAEALRHWQSSDEATMLTRVCAAIALCAGLISTLELLRPHPRHVAELGSRQFTTAWWFPFFDGEYESGLSARGARWKVSVALYALCVFAIPAVALMSSVQHKPSGEIMLFPGQDGQEAYRELYPERDLRRGIGLKLQLVHADVQDGVPYALVRATDMETTGTTDITLRSSHAVRVRENVYALRELRPVDGVGGVTLRAYGDEIDETLVMYPGGEETLLDGSTLRWEDTSPNRFGTLGAALQFQREMDGEILDRRWVYLDFPELNALRAEGDLAYAITNVERPLAAMLSVKALGGPAWGWMGAVLLAGLFILLFLQRTLPLQKVGRPGDHMVLSPPSAHAVVVETVKDGVDSPQTWVTLVEEEDLV